MSGKWLAGIAGVAVGLGCLFVPTSAQALDVPKIVLSAPSWDFGTVRHPQKPEYVLTVNNGGTAELVLTKVESNCGCTVAQPAKYVLQPGESTDVKVVFDTQGKSGKVYSKVTIKSNDPARAEVFFDISGFVRRAVQMTPPYGLGFRMLDPSASPAQTVRLVNQEPEPMQVELKPFASGKFSAELREVRPGQEYEVVVTARPPFSRTPLRDILEIGTGLKEEPLLQVSVRAQLVGRVELYPVVFYMGPTITERVRRTALVQYFGADPQFKVTSVVCQDPNIKITQAPPEAGSKALPGQLQTTLTVRLDLDLPPSSAIPAAGVPIKVSTNDPDFSEVQLIVTTDPTLYRKLTHEENAAPAKPGP